jgi:hypothetical protein
VATKKRGGARREHAPLGDTKEDALEQIKEVLKAAKDKIVSDETTERYDLKNPLGVTIYTHVNSDGSVDGELRISELPDNLPAREALIVLTEGNPIKTFKGLWSSIGIRFSPIPDAELSENYTRFRGLSQESTYYARSSIRALDHQRSIVQLIVENMGEAGLPKPSNIYVRLHWNKMNQKPGERYDRKVKK